MNRAAIQGILLAAVMTGCRSSNAPDTATTAPALQTVHTELRQTTPALEKNRFSTLLDFELDVDSLFCVAASPPVATDARAHTGTRSLQIPAGVSAIDFKLDSLMSGRRLPGPYSMIGAYLWSDHAQTVRILYTLPSGERLDHAVEVQPQHWQAIMLDLTALSDLKPEDQNVGRLTLELSDPQAPTLIDDLLLVDNVQRLVDRNGFIVQRRGGMIQLQLPHAPGMAFKDADYYGSQGWTLEEWSPLRLRLSSGNNQKSITIYRDGRRFVDGGFSPLEENWMKHAAEHDTPGALTIPNEMGRPNRNTRGDANNDGYNETTGAYQALATGARIDITLQPNGDGIERPIIEIAGLPRGDVLATVEGTLVTEMVRLEDGRLLVILPGNISRAVTLNLRLQ